MKLCFYYSCHWKQMTRWSKGKNSEKSTWIHVSGCWPSSVQGSSLWIDPLSSIAGQFIGLSGTGQRWKLELHSCLLFYHSNGPVALNFFNSFSEKTWKKCIVELCRLHHCFSCEISHQVSLKIFEMLTYATGPLWNKCAVELKTDFGQ